MNYLAITMAQMPAIIKQLGEGMLTTMEIFFLTLALSLPLGLIVALGRISKSAILRNITKFYISVMRGTPLMLQLIVVYFGPYLIFGISITNNYRMPATIIAFVINYAAYFAEIYRGGIESIEKGQYEAAEILGFSKSQTFIRIILPQVIKRVIPSVTNEAITLVKDTSLAFAISVTEMFTIAERISSAKTSMIPYAVAAVFYYVFNYVVAFVMERIEKALDYYKA